MLKALFLVVLPLALVSASRAQTSPSPSLVVEGRAAPALVVLDANGKTHTLSELRGKKSLLITFFPRCFTGNCTSQLTSLRDAYPQLQKAGVEVWAVSTDRAEGPHGQRAFAKYLHLPFVLVPDPDRRLCLLFGAVHTKEQMAARMSVFITSDGTIQWIDKQISPRTHGADVLARVATQPVTSSSPSTNTPTTVTPATPASTSARQPPLPHDEMAMERSVGFGQTPFRHLTSILLFRQVEPRFQNC